MSNILRFGLALALISSMWAQESSAILSGSQKVSYHEYQLQKAALNKNPVLCEVLEEHLDVGRITAVKGLKFADCGTCLRVVSPKNETNVHYIMAMDSGGMGLDLNGDTFQSLNGGERSGLTFATWEIVNSLNCHGVVRGGNYTLPGFDKYLNYDYYRPNFKLVADGTAQSYLLAISIPERISNNDGDTVTSVDGSVVTAA